MKSQIFLFFSMTFLMASQNCTVADEFADAIQTIRKVDAKGAGHDAAIKAMAVLNQATADQIPQLLIAMDDANPLVQNWFRGAINSALAKSDSIPTDSILKFFKGPSHSHQGRLLAFELLKNANDKWAKEMVPTMHDDVSLPLRRKSIKWHIAAAKDESDKIKKIGLLGFALDKARDVDQIQSIKSALAKEGIQIDLTRQLGYALDWQLVGPFDNSDQKGFDVAYGPEKGLPKIDVAANYTDGKQKDGKATEVKWQSHSTTDEGGAVDLNKAVGKYKGAIVYAFTEFSSDKDQEVEIRIGCINANKVWVNGELIISNEIYHVGMMPDQFSGKAKLQKGKNQILFKVCQNEQTQPWAQRWMFGLRICDHTGKAIGEAAEDAGQAGGQ